MIQIAVLGYGTIGSGVAEVLKVNKESITKRVGDEISIKYILDLREFPGDPMEDKIVHDYAVIKNDPEIAIVVEAMGGVEPAYTFAKQALESGKHFATSNKALIAEKGAELIRIAKEKNVNCMFEASVGGGIPIIRPLNSCLTADVIEEVSGILNGTTNYMMTKMSSEGSEFEDVLKDAQQKGYAEADPTADIEGYDAGRKMAIMASIAFNSRVTFDDVYTEGITNITAKDIKYAKEMGCDIKLLGVAKNTEEGIEAYVCPMLIPSSHPLASVNDSFNAVFVHGDAVDDAMFYGRGAGEFPTASAVMGDIIDVARNIQFYCTGRIHCTCYKDLPIKKITEIESKYFMRLLVDDKPGVLARIADTLGKNQVSIAQVIQKNKVNDMAELVVITDLVLEQNFADALVEIKGMEHTREISTVIRVY